MVLLMSVDEVNDLSLEERGEACMEREFRPGDDHVSLVLQMAYRWAFFFLSLSVIYLLATLAAHNRQIK